MMEKIKVLFVVSGNSQDFDISPFVKAQGVSLMENGIDVSYFHIRGRGIFGYLKCAIALRKHLKIWPCDLIHAHYTLTGWTAIIARTKKPVVLSLMGTDTIGDHIGENKIRLSSLYLKLLTKLIQPFVAKLICKSKHIESFVYQKKKSVVIPNGILLEKFTVNSEGFREELGLHQNIRYLLFLGNKHSINKNFRLAEAAVDKLKNPDIKLIAPYPVSHDEVVKYLNSVDCLIVPSFMEGSPNVVKEAMACKCPVVATDVGDIRWLFGNEPGYFITSFDPLDAADKINKAMEFSQKYGRTDGRRRIIELGLDAGNVAKRLIEVYNDVLSERLNK